MTQVAPCSLIRVNGAEEPLTAANISQLLEGRAISAQLRGVAVAVNGRVIPRTRWPTTALAAGDAVEIVLAKPGG